MGRIGREGFAGENVKAVKEWSWLLLPLTSDKLSSFVQKYKTMISHCLLDICGCLLEYLVLVWRGEVRLSQGGVCRIFLAPAAREQDNHHLIKIRRVSF